MSTELTLKKLASLYRLSVVYWLEEFESLAHVKRAFWSAQSKLYQNWRVFAYCVNSWVALAKSQKRQHFAWAIADYVKYNFIHSFCEVTAGITQLPYECETGVTLEKFSSNNFRQFFIPTLAMTFPKCLSKRQALIMFGTTNLTVSNTEEKKFKTNVRITADNQYVFKMVFNSWRGMIIRHRYIICKGKEGCY